MNDVAALSKNLIFRLVYAMIHKRHLALQYVLLPHSMLSMKILIGNHMNLNDLKEELSHLYRYRIELHAHTSPASKCSDVTPRELVETYRSLGYDAIHLTNHFVFSEDRSKEESVAVFLDDYYETKRYGDALGLKIYLGAEIRFTENANDYLVFGVCPEMLGEIYGLLKNGVEYFRKNYPMPDSVFVQAHPKRNKMEDVAPELLDGVEVYNMHPNHNSRIGLAAFCAKRDRVPIVTAGTDYHHKNCDHEGLSALRVKYLPDDAFGLAKLLRTGDYLLEIGRENLVIP